MARKSAFLSAAQRDLLVALADGCRLEFTAMVTARLYDQSGRFIGFPDMRSVNGLWRRDLLLLGPPEERGTGSPLVRRDIRRFGLTLDGRTVLEANLA